MFSRPGTLYVYRSYGIHWCANIATGPEGEGQAVLLRGGVPIEGLDLIQLRRGRTDHLTDGPGKLTHALAITGVHDGTDVLTGPVHIEFGDAIPMHSIEASPRIGITKATGRRWRFIVPDA